MTYVLLNNYNLKGKTRNILNEYKKGTFVIFNKSNLKCAQNSHDV